jgi:hypothetical protein
MIEWLGTAASVIGSFLVGMTFYFVGYIFFVVGSVSWFYIGFKKRDNALMVLNGFFMTANVIGIYNVF